MEFESPCGLDLDLTAETQRLVRAGPMTALADAALDTTFSSPDEVEELVPREEPKPPEGGGGAALVSREAASSDIEHV